MGFYDAIVVINEFLMITMVLHVVFYREFNKTQKAWFIATFVGVMFCNAAEYAVHCGFYNPIFKIPLTILTVLQFSLAPIMAMLFAGALGLKHQGKIAIGFFATNLIMEIILACFGKIFYFNDAGYQRGDLFILYDFVYAISLGYLLVSLVLVGLHFKHRDITTIGLVLVGLVVGGIIPMTFFKLNVAYLSTITIWYSRIQKTNLWIMKENFLKFKATLSLAWQTLLKAVIQKQENTLIEQAVMSESSQKKRGLKVSMLIKLPIILSSCFTHLRQCTMSAKSLFPTRF